MKTNELPDYTEKQLQTLVDELHDKAGAFNSARWAVEEAGLRVKASFNEEVLKPEGRLKHVWLAVIVTTVNVLQSTRQQELRKEREERDR